MKKIIIYSLVIMSAVGLMSCEKWLNGQVIDFDLPDHTPVLTVYAFYEAGQNIVDTKVGSSVSIVSQGEPQPVDDVNIKLYENDQLVEEWSPVATYIIDTLWWYFDPQLNDTIYFIDSSFTYQHTLAANLSTDLGEYKLEVSAPGYETVSSTLSIPAKANVTNASFERDVPVNLPSWASGQAEDNGDKIKFTIDDPSGENNFYHIKFLFEYGDSTYSYIQDAYLEINETGFNYDNGGYLLTDQYFDGQQRSFEFEKWYWMGEEKPNKIQIHVHAMPKSYSDFKTSLDKYWDAEYNPFAEPVILYSNIKNGLGLFSVHNPSVIILE